MTTSETVAAYDPERGIEELLTVSQAADLLGTSPTFPRRLIAERRIRFVRLGRLVRIPRSAVQDFVAQNSVEPMTYRGRRMP